MKIDGKSIKHLIIYRYIKIYRYIQAYITVCIHIYIYIASHRSILLPRLFGNIHVIYCIYNVYIYPPTPALAKAGAAPGTTAGVELLLLRFPRSNPSRSQQAAPRLLLRFPRSNPSRSQQAAPRPHRVNIFQTLKRWLGMLHPAANSHPEATHQWLLLGRLNNPLACFILQPPGTPRPHINGFLWASKPAVCQPFNP